MPRSRFSERKVLAVAIRQGAIIPCYRCRVAFKDGDVIEREHLHELALGGEDTPENCAYSHCECHAAITNGTKATTAGSSKHRIAKAERVARKWSQPLPEGKIRSAGFRKNIRRKMDGTVERREA